MTKTDLFNSVTKQTGIERHVVKEVINVFIETIKHELWIGKHVRIKGLMNFILIKRNAYESQNPQTGEKITIPKQYRVKMELSRTFRHKIKTKNVY